MLAVGYLDLAPEAPTIALSVDNAETAAARLQRAGIDLSAPKPGAWGDVRFATLSLDSPDGHLQLIQHFTPEALRAPRFLGHANHATAVTEVVVATAALAETAARVSRLAGRAVQPDPAGGFVLELTQTRLRMLAPAAVAALFPGATARPGTAAIVLRTDDRNAALRRRLAYWNIAHQESEGGVTLTAADLVLRFVPA
jgi:hypothetical protein